MGRLPVSSRKYATPLRLEVGASTRVRIAVVVIHAGVLWVIPHLTAVTFFSKLLLVLAVAGIFMLTWSRRGELNGRKVSLLLGCDGQWHWCDGEDDIPVHLQGSSYVNSSLVILNFRTLQGDRHFSIVLPGDNCDREDLRRLRVRAKEGIQER